MADNSTNQQTTIINVQDNLAEYAKNAAEARKSVDELKKANEDLKNSGTATAEEIEASNAALKNAQKEYRNAAKALENATAANKANGTSYNDLYKQWVAAEQKLKALQGTIVKNADGTYTLSEAYIEAKKQAEEAKKALDAFGAGTNNNRLNVGNYTKSIKEALKGQLGFSGSLLSTAGIFGVLGAAIGGAISFIKSGIQSTIEFEKSVSSLRALTGASTEDIKYYKEAAKDLGDQFGVTGKDMIEAFKIVGSAKSELLKSKEGLVAVTEAAITLSKAAEMDVPEAAKSLTTVMNQFGASASEASRYINAMAAGAKEGAAEIPDLSDSITKFGAVAAAANLNVEQSVALIEALSEKGLKGEVAGTGIKSFLLKLEQGAKETRPSIVGLNTALDNLAKQHLTNAQVANKFGLETANVALTLINNKDRVNELTKAVAGTNEAYKQAAINQDNVAGSLDKLGAKWENFKQSLLDGNGTLSTGLKTVVKGMSFAIDIFGNAFKGSQELIMDSMVKTTKEQLSSYQKIVNATNDLNKLNKDIVVFENKKVELSKQLAAETKKNNTFAIDLINVQMKMYNSMIKMVKDKEEAEQKASKQTKDVLKKTPEELKKEWEQYLTNRRYQLEAEKILAGDNYEKLKKNIIDFYNLDLKKADITNSQRYLLEVQKNKALNDLHAKYLLDQEAAEKEHQDFMRSITDEANASEDQAIKQMNETRKSDAQARIETRRIEADGELTVLRDILDDEYVMLTQSDEYKNSSRDQQALMDAKYASQRMAISKDIADYEKRLDEQALANKRATFQATADLMGSMSELIGQETVAGKSFAVAQAIINTYLAASQALANSGGNPILAAIQVASIVAMGLVQVKNIMKVKVGKNASNSASASSGGGQVVSSTFTAANTQNVAQQSQAASSVGGGVQQSVQNAQAQANATANLLQNTPIVVSVEAFEAKAAQKKKVEVTSNL